MEGNQTERSRKISDLNGVNVKMCRSDEQTYYDFLRFFFKKNKHILFFFVLLTFKMRINNPVMFSFRYLVYKIRKTEEEEEEKRMNMSIAF